MQADRMFGSVGERDTCRSTCLHTCESESFDVSWGMSALWWWEGDWKCSLPSLHQLSPPQPANVCENHLSASPHVCKGVALNGCDAQKKRNGHHGRYLCTKGGSGTENCPLHWVLKATIGSLRDASGGKLALKSIKSHILP